MNSPVVQLGAKRLKLSNLDKVLYPGADFTKGQVIDYYRRISPVLLPHLKYRPLTLKRYPEGVDAGHFYEKRCPAHKPDWVKTARVWSDSSDEWMDYCLANDLPSLVWVANLASLELHVLLSKITAIERPTTMVFDFDPGPPATLLDCIRVALRMRELLAGLGLQSFPKTSGGKGLHLYIPLNGRADFEQTKTVSRAIAQVLERDDPARVTTNMRKDLRADKIFIDWSQNDNHKTTVCAYSLRAQPYPTVSTPVTWEELEAVKTRNDLRRLRFEADDVLARVEELGDLHAPILTLKQKLPASPASRVQRGAAAP